MTGDPVEVFDLGSSPDGAPATGRRPGPGTGESRPAGAVPARLALIAAVIALVGLAAAVAQWHHRARTITVVHTIAAGSPVSVDASGCPTATTCDVTDGAGRLAATVQAWDPQSTIVSGSQLRTSAGVPVRSTLVAKTSVIFPNGSPLERAQSVLVIVTQCVPGGAALSSSQRANASRSVQTVTIAGRTGCSVTITSESEDGVPVPIESLDDLANRPGLQL